VVHSNDGEREKRSQARLENQLAKGYEPVGPVIAHKKLITVILSEAKNLKKIDPSPAAQDDRTMFSLSS
jgi:hypothetical protein